MSLVAVIDFEATGIRPQRGARATEVAAVLLQGTRVVGHYASLMHTGSAVSPYIADLTGISNAMLRVAPPARVVMAGLCEFTRGASFAAHAAHSDRAFFLSECALGGLGGADAPHFVCTLQLARKVYPDAPSHKLGALGHHLGLAAPRAAHRALADATLTAQLFVRLRADIARALGELGAPSFEPDPAFLVALQRRREKRLRDALARVVASRAVASA